MRLLEHGLLVAANALDNVTLKESKKGGDEEEDDDESYEAFESRVRRFVTANIERASLSKRDDYKDSLVYQARKDTILAFMHAIVERKKCLNCNA
jgi:hypothetical protein